jgi:DNA-binding transcriptional MerR regulator
VVALMRIGELSRRTGVSPELLRAWEQRYGLLRPTRSPGGFRLYSAEDEERVRRTTALLADGLSAAEAARSAATPAPVEPSTQTPLVADLAAHLKQALDGFDASAGHAALDRVFSAVSLELAITEVIIPYLHDLGERWAEGTASVAQEHFASHLIRGRLLGLARDWGADGTYSVVLACLPGEAHDLGLILFGALISRRGWRVTFLGADTPLDTLEATVQQLRPTLVLLATYDAARFHQHADAIAALAAATPVTLVAPVDDQAVEKIGAQALARDIDEAVAFLSTR